MKYQGIVGLILTVGFVQALPKYESIDKEFSTDKGNSRLNEDQVAMESTMGINATERQETVQDRPPRFGFPTYSQDIQTPGNALPGVYGPVKLDIGGLVLGTIVGLGAFFILPKLFHVVSSPYGAYKRSEDEVNGGSGIADLMTSIQSNLEAYNINSTECLQRAICFSVQSASEKTGNNTANSLESAIDNVAKNDVMKTLIDGTKWKKAVDVAEKGEDCTSAFPKCPTEVDSIISAIANYFMS